MAETLEQRVDELEKRVSDLTAVVAAKPSPRRWVSTVGAWTDDEISREAERLGQEYRQSVREFPDRVGA